MNASAEIWSTYGQLEKIIAEVMFEEGKANKIPFEAMPPTQQYNERGDRAYFAIVIGRKFVPEFERRLADIRA